ncbi:MAG: hypothetical protein KKH98_11360 [Spirochaetes bacterium]|nr:hypothetical protein [Spirochaetota bacterium]
MKKYLIISLTIIFTLSLSLYAEESGSEKGKAVTNFPFYIFTEFKSKSNHYFPSGWMGDHGDLKVKQNYKKNAKGGTTAIQIKYTAEGKQGQSWAGIYWQNPANNWGTQKGGFDLRKAKSLQFYARGEKGSEVVEVKMGGITGRYSDSDSETSGKIVLTDEWKLYTIDLSDHDLSYVGGGLCVIFTADDNPDGCTLYLDEILYSDQK